MKTSHTTGLEIVIVCGIAGRVFPHKTIHDRQSNHERISPHHPVISLYIHV